MAFGLVICGMISGVIALLFALINGSGIGLALLGYIGCGMGGMAIAILAITVCQMLNTEKIDGLSDALHG